MSSRRSSDRIRAEVVWGTPLDMVSVDSLACPCNQSITSKPWEPRMRDVPIWLAIIAASLPDVHVHAGQPRDDQRPPRDQPAIWAPRSRSCSGSSTRTPSRLRGLHPVRRRPRRPVRPPNGVRRRHRRVHPRLGVLGAQHRAVDAHPRPGGAGTRRRGDHAALAHAAGGVGRGAHSVRSRSASGAASPASASRSAR